MAFRFGRCFCMQGRIRSLDVVVIGKISLWSLILSVSLSKVTFLDFPTKFRLILRSFTRALPKRLSFFLSATTSKGRDDVCIERSWTLRNKREGICLGKMSLNSCFLKKWLCDWRSVSRTSLVSVRRRCEPFFNLSFLLQKVKGFKCYNRYEELSFYSFSGKLRNL